MKRLGEKYTNFLLKEYVFIFIICLLVSTFLLVKASDVEMDMIEYEKVLPSDSRTVMGMNFIKDQFMNTDGVTILLTKSDQSSSINFLNYEYLSYIEKVQSNIETLPFVETTSSLSDVVKTQNNDSLMISSQDIKTIMNDENIILPMDPVEVFEKYLNQFGELNDALNYQSSSITKLTNVSNEIRSSFYDISIGLKEMESETSSVESTDVTSGTIALVSGVDELSSGLDEVSQVIYSLSDVEKNTYCSATIIDPKYGDTGLPNPYKNDTICNYYKNNKIVDSYNLLKNYYCAILDVEKCNYYTELLENDYDKYDVSIYDSYTELSQILDNDIQEGLSAIDYGIEASGEGLVEFKDNILKVSQSLDLVNYYMDLLDSGMVEYNSNMELLDNMTLYLSENLDEQYKSLEELYNLINNNLNLDFNEQEYKIENVNDFNSYLSKDKTSSIISVTLKKGYDIDYINKQINEVLESIEKPENIEFILTGTSIESLQMQDMIPDAMNKTSLVAGIFIIIILILLIKNIPMSLITLSTVAFGTLWSYGILGTFGIRINAAAAGAISMIIGIGIDFGIQIVSEYMHQKDTKKENIHDALRNTINFTIKPILITTGSALLGFYAMSLAEVTIMKDMSLVLMLGVFMCFVASYTVLLSLILILEKIKKRFKNGKKI